MNKLKKSSADMVKAARAWIEEIETSDAITLVNNSDMVFIDLRDVRERQCTGFIPGSFHCPRGMLKFWVDPESPYFKNIFAQEIKYIFYCASGWRSALSVATLKNMGFEATHLKDGFSSWKEKGGSVERLDSKND